MVQAGQRADTALQPNPIPATGVNERGDLV
jgi:hypothetical protein